jgi:hypothetical protein
MERLRLGKTPAQPSGSDAHPSRSPMTTGLLRTQNPYPAPAAAGRGRQAIPQRRRGSKELGADERPETKLHKPERGQRLMPSAPAGGSAEPPRTQHTDPATRTRPLAACCRTGPRTGAACANDPSTGRCPPGCPAALRPPPHRSPMRHFPPNAVRGQASFPKWRGFLTAPQISIHLWGASFTTNARAHHSSYF